MLSFWRWLMILSVLGCTDKADEKADAAAKDAGGGDACVAKCPNGCQSKCADAADSGHDAGADAGRVCAELAAPEHGDVAVPSRATDAEATYSCDEGYQLKGAAKRRCQSSGEWSGDAPTCESSACPTLQAPEHGQVSVDHGTELGSKAQYTCDAMYQLIGSPTRTCQDDGEWSGTAPTCTCGDDLQTDAMNCGTCGTRCGSGTCQAGACVRRVFVTSSTLSPMFSTLTQADAACKTLALGANVHGTFKAWLSDASATADSRFVHGDGEYRRLDGVKVANNWDDLSDGSLIEAIDVTEHGTPASGSNTFVYTGTQADGSLVTVGNADPDSSYGATCSNWTIANDTVRGAYGDYNATDSTWSYTGMRQGCSMALRLYCVEQ